MKEKELEQLCDRCKFPDVCLTQEKLDEQCAQCPIHKINQQKENSESVGCCPHCGGRAEVVIMPRRYFKFYQVRCFDCGCQTGEETNPDEAVKRWNQRF